MDELKIFYSLTRKQQAVARKYYELDGDEAAICEELGIKVSTFKSHLALIYQQLGLHTRRTAKHSRRSIVIRFIKYIARIEQLERETA